MVGNKSADELHGRQKKLDVERYKQERTLSILEIIKKYLKLNAKFVFFFCFLCCRTSICIASDRARMTSIMTKSNQNTKRTDGLYRPFRVVHTCSIRAKL